MKPLINVNASCFMNTVLQSLFTSIHFNNDVLKALSQGKDKVIANTVISAYCLLSKSLVTDQHVKVYEFVNSIRSHDSRWEGMCDSLEFFEYILNALEQLTGTDLCQITQHTSYTLDCGHSGVIDDKTSKDHCLYLEQLADTNASSIIEYKCSKCPLGSVSKATSTTYIQQLPSILIVIINQCPQSIDLTLTLKDQSGEKKYQLRAIYCYVGIGSGGHYFAVIHHQGQLFICDDQMIRRTTGISQRTLAYAKQLIYEQIQDTQATQVTQATQ